MSQHALELRNAIMLRPGTNDVPLFAPISAVLNPGDLMTVEGKSGTGKSTLIDAVLGLNRNFRGAIKLFDAIDVARLPVGKRQSLLARDIGYVGQSCRLFLV